MTVSMERVVRPFETTDVFTNALRGGNIPPPVDDPAAEDLPDITVTGAADSKYTEAPPPPTLGFSAEWREISSQRSTVTERVENPDDSNQFVNVEKIKGTTFANTRTGEQMRLKLDF